MIDALLGLLHEHPVVPSADAIAERSGVSLSSLFRYFDDLGDLQRQTIETHFERSASLFELPAIGEGPLEDRIKRFVDARLDLYDAIAPLARLARARAIEPGLIADSLHQTRTRFAAQVGRHFSPEVDTCSPAAGEDLVALVDTLTSFEAWDLTTATHGRTRRQVRRAWTTALTALLSPPRPANGR